MGKGNKSKNKGMQLEFIEPIDGKVVLGDEDSVPIRDTWGVCLVGCFTGHFPGVKVVYGIMKSWGVACELIPYSDSREWIFFKFKSVEDREKVFGGGPYEVFHDDNNTLMLKKVHDGFLFDDDLFLDIAIWIKFFDVPLNYWNPKGLGKIASKLGRPLYSDQVTNEFTSATYARILVEIDLRKKPIFEYEVETPMGPYTQKVTYENFPDYCFHCTMFGHSWDGCGKLEELTKQVVEEAKNAPPEEPNVKLKTVPTVLEQVSVHVSAPDLRHDLAIISPHGSGHMMAPAPPINGAVLEHVLPYDVGAVLSMETKDSGAVSGRRGTVLAPEKSLEETGSVDPCIDAQVGTQEGDTKSAQDEDDDTSSSEDDDDDTCLFITEITEELAAAMRIRNGKIPWTKEKYDLILEKAKEGGFISIDVTLSG